MGDSSDYKTPHIIFINKAKVKLSQMWGKTAKGRFIKQHGSIDEIPEGDAHAVPKYTNPSLPKPPSPEEEQAAEEILTKHIEELKQKKETPPPPKLPKNDFYDNWSD